MDSKQNSYGLYDAPIRSTTKGKVILTQEELQRQLDAGAFNLSRDRAIALGFINPDDEQDTVIVEVREK